MVEELKKVDEKLEGFLSLNQIKDFLEHKIDIILSQPQIWVLLSEISTDSTDRIDYISYEIRHQQLPWCSTLY